MLGVIRVLRRAGIPALVYGDPHGLETRSRWYRAAPLPPGARPRALRDLLEVVRLEHAVLLPCSDAWARQVAALPDAYRTRFPASVSAPDVMDQLVDKAGLSKILSAAGVPHPATRLVPDASALTELPDHVFEGAFLKPHDSQAFFARYGVKAFQVANRAEAAARLRDAQAAGLEVLLQEYIPGPADLHYFVDGFVDAGGVLRGAFARHRHRMHPSDFGNSSFMESVSPDSVRQAIDAMRTLVGRIGFRGIFSTEFKRDPRDGGFKLIEINARPWWYVEFAARCGLDVCSMAYRDALGEPVPDVAAYRVGERLVYPYYDYFACREARQAGRMTVAGWLRSWLGAQEPMFNWTDPAPAFLEAWVAVRDHARNVMSRGGRR